MFLTRQYQSAQRRVTFGCVETCRRLFGCYTGGTSWSLVLGQKGCRFPLFRWVPWYGIQKLILRRFFFCSIFLQNVRHRELCSSFRWKLSVIWYEISMFVNVLHSGEVFKFFLGHETVSLAHFRQGLDNFLPMQQLICPFTKAVCISVLRVWSVNRIQVLLIEMCNLASKHGRSTEYVFSHKRAWLFTRILDLQDTNGTCQ